MSVRTSVEPREPSVVYRVHVMCSESCRANNAYRKGICALRWFLHFSLHSGQCPCAIFALQPTPFGYTNQRRPPVHSTSPLSTCSTCAPRSAGRAHASHASQARAPGCTYTAHLSESRRAARRLPPAHCLQETRRSGLATSSFNRLCATVDGSQTVRLQCLAVRGATPGGMALENDEQLRSWLSIRRRPSCD